MTTEEKDPLEVEVARIVAQLYETVTPFFNQIAEAIGQMAAILADNWAQIVAAWSQVPTMEFVLAYAWACGARPEWVTRLNRTKKKRTRKKYQDRILRAYLNREE